MKISWMGHSCFLLETSSGTKIITDPYESGSYDGAVKYADLDIDADIVTTSHSHADHCYTEKFTNARIINQTEKIAIKDVELFGIKSFHDNQKGALRGSNIIYTIKADGISLVHFGDLGTTDIDFSSLDDCDIALIPIGGTFTIDSRDADFIIERLKPAITIPMHFKTKKLDFSIDGVDEFLKGKDFQEKDQLEVSLDSIKTYPQIILLKYQK